MDNKIINAVKGAIIAKFGSLEACAEFLDIDQSTLSRNLKVMSESTLSKLMEAGVDLSEINIVVGRDKLQSQIGKKNAINNGISAADLEIKMLWAKVSEQTIEINNLKNEKEELLKEIRILKEKKK